MDRATPAPPHWVIYGDRYVAGSTGPPAPSEIKGYNVFILSFLLTEGAWDKASEWTTLTAAQRATVKAQYAAAGIRLLVSAFGSTDVPTTSGADPIATAVKMANWVIKYDLDGIDVDYESVIELFFSFPLKDSAVQEWLIKFTTQLREHLPQDEYIITHARTFTPGHYKGGGFLKVHASVGHLIDWYNIQGATEYTSCANLLTTSSSMWPKTALFQIAASGVPVSKLVIGKPAGSSSATDGFMSPSMLAGCLSTAKKQGWNAGAMVWAYPDAAAPWIKTVRGSSWPI
ncbi:glycoside hydrolase [Mycena belliarum]|uniref:Glycoside hydrolase n=1 Tax=Mycena belliarum TaxID=1033014 RepID=A0AAD6U8Q2_9AGAR|nr:glycoside hydrolase [Mycena belliae]